MSETAKLVIDGQDYEFDIITGSEGERGIDFTKLRARTGVVSLDPAYGSTGSCNSAITFIDGEKGILRYRGYPIEEVAQKGVLRGGLLPADLRRAAHRAEQLDEVQATTSRTTRCFTRT